MTLRKKFGGVEDDSRLTLTKMIIDFTGEHWVDNYRAFIHCACLVCNRSAIGTRELESRGKAACENAKTNLARTLRESAFEPFVLRKLLRPTLVS